MAQNSQSEPQPRAVQIAASELLHALIRGDLADGEARPEVAAPDPAVLEVAIASAVRSKMLPAFAAGAGRLREATALAAVERAVAAYRRAALVFNARMLANAADVADQLDSANVRFVLFKGPLQQQQIYGDMFVRPSGDLDVLVSRSDFAPAARALAAAGYTSAHGLSLWWTTFLGQEHFLPPGARSWSIDLHHRIQQPGAQQPRDEARFVEESAWLTLGRRQLPVLAPRFVPMLCAVNLVKSLYRRSGVRDDAWRSSAGSHACDLYESLGRGDPERTSEFLATARTHGLEGTALLALRTLSVLFDDSMEKVRADFTVMLPQVPDEVLARMILVPALVENWPRPGEVLVATCGVDKARLAKELAWYGMSETVRKAMRGIRLSWSRHQ